MQCPRSLFVDMPRLRSPDGAPRRVFPDSPQKLPIGRAEIKKLTPPRQRSFADDREVVSGVVDSRARFG
jgi:hypothetical protein